MKRRIAYLTVITMLCMLTACDDYNSTGIDQSSTFEAQSENIATKMIGAMGVKNFRTHLSGDQEVPAVDTKAQGEATFKVSKDGTSISYKLIVANIENVFMTHIHLAAKGQNGPVAVWLYPVGGPPPQLIEGRFSGVLAEGIITVDDLTGPLDEEESLDELIEEMKSGGAYVNVHTTQNEGGEIRGQIF